MLSQSGMLENCMAFAGHCSMYCCVSILYLPPPCGYLSSLQAVNHLHDHNLCHFDIKPANAFIGVCGMTCKLGDFGLVVALDDPESVVSAQEGDPKYMAPELMKAEFGKPADIFR